MKSPLSMPERRKLLIINVLLGLLLGSPHLKIANIQAGAFMILT